MGFLNITDDITSNSLCVTLPLLIPETEIFDYDLSGVFLTNNFSEFNGISIINDKISNNHDIKKEKCVMNSSENDDNDILIIADENGESTFFEAHDDNTIVPIDAISSGNPNEALQISLPENNKTKRKRKRIPMNYIMCSKCPVRYRFVAKLKEHMKAEHNIDLFACMVCLFKLP